MGVIGRRDRSDSRASGFLPRRPSLVDAPVPNVTEIPIERANHGSTPDISGLEPSIYGGSSFRTPTRSFYHRSFKGSQDPAHYSSQGLREQTAELASFALSLPHERGSFPRSLDIFQSKRQTDVAAPSSSYTSTAGDLSIVEPEPIHAPATGSSVLTQMIRSPPSESVGDDTYHYGGKRCPKDAAGVENPRPVFNDGEGENTITERTSLLNKTAPSKPFHGYGVADDIERQYLLGEREQGGQPRALATIRSCLRLIASPKSWNGRAVWQQGGVYPASLLPSVFLGLLLNILDALSYGMILFPLGEPIFSDLGSDGISMFYVSTVIAQLVFSCGGSIFRGGIGSEMIEVVPFFHKMAMTILLRVGEDNPKSVLATTILAFSASSVLTGLVFFLMGTCKLGSLIGFFPRHILIGCIGGVGFFLMQTGVEVSARLSGSLELNGPTLQKLFHMDTFLLWMIPLFLAIAFLVLKRFVRSNFLVGGYFVTVGVVFYIVKFGARVSMDTLRSRGWVFDAPSSSNPWYHFYTLYDFSAVDWSAFVDTIPAMFALTFFGVLHVPINVPALGISTGEDNLSVDRELIAHGVTNALSGFAGSIQNYLVYTNSLLFIASGGNSRLAGIMLAFATMGILVVGPAIIGFIPVMVVGALIFMLGIELMEEALVDTWGKLHRLEYLTVSKSHLVKEPPSDPYRSSVSSSPWVLGTLWLASSSESSWHV